MLLNPTERISFCKTVMNIGKYRWLEAVLFFMIAHAIMLAGADFPRVTVHKTGFTK